MLNRWTKKEKTTIAISGALLLCLLAIIAAFIISFNAISTQLKLGQTQEEFRLLQESNQRLEGQIKRLKDTVTENAGRLKTKEEQLADAERMRLELDGQRQLRLAEEKREQDILKSAQQKVETLLSKDQGSVFLKENALTVRLANSVLFASGRASLTSEGTKVMAAVAQLLNSELKELAVHVEGHTDADPIGAVLKQKYPSNWELSSARASASVTYLIDQGVDPLRLSALGRADTVPVDSNDEEEGRAKNRRIDIVIDLKDSKQLTGN